MIKRSIFLEMRSTVKPDTLGDGCGLSAYERKHNTVILAEGMPVTNTLRPLRACEPAVLPIAGVVCITPIGHIVNSIFLIERI